MLTSFCPVHGRLTIRLVLQTVIRKQKDKEQKQKETNKKQKGEKKGRKKEEGHTVDAYYIQVLSELSTAIRVLKFTPK